MGEKPRLTIDAREAVDLIRAGISDDDLMKGYDISARSLERLFRKLVEAGEIRQVELDQRMLKSSRSDVVGVVSYGASMHRTKKNKIRLNASEVVASIRSRISDIELMEKYNLSVRGLNRLFRRLVERGDIDQGELDERMNAFRWGEVAFITSEGRDPEPIDDDQEDEAPSIRDRFAEFVLEHKVFVAAALGAIGGMVVTLTTLVVIIGPSKAIEITGIRTAQADSAIAPEDPINALAEQIIRILESIARGDSVPVTSQSSTGSTKYQECIKECDNQFSGGDDFDRSVRINCRKNCVILYSERMRKIRELYHGAGPGR